MSKFPYPKNDAATDAPLIEVIKKRWSPLAFSDEPIEPEKIQALLEAMRWAQSSFNEQPWRLIYATKDDAEDFERLSLLLMEGNSWAKDAYFLALGCAVPNLVYNNKPNGMAGHDTGAAMNNIFLQAVGMDLVAHEMGGYDHEAAYQKLGIPKDVMVTAMIAVGYPGDETKIEPDQQKKRFDQHQERKNLSEIAFKGKWLAS